MHYDDKKSDQVQSKMIFTLKIDCILNIGKCFVRYGAFESTCTFMVLILPTEMYKDCLIAILQDEIE